MPLDRTPSNARSHRFGIRLPAAKYAISPKCATNSGPDICGYAIKTTAECLWDQRDVEEIKADWKAWYGWAIRSRLDPVKKAAKTIKSNLAGIVNAISMAVSNARAAGINSVIQKLERRACGYRNRSRFRNAVYFHLGGFDLYPRAGEA